MVADIWSRSRHTEVSQANARYCDGGSEQENGGGEAGEGGELLGGYSRSAVGSLAEHEGVCVQEPEGECGC